MLTFITTRHQIGSTLSRGSASPVPQRDRRIAAAHYHAGLSNTLRTKVQNSWRSGGVQVPHPPPSPPPPPRPPCPNTTILLPCSLTVISGTVEDVLQSFLLQALSIVCCTASEHDLNGT